MKFVPCNTVTSLVVEVDRFVDLIYKAETPNFEIMHRASFSPMLKRKRVESYWWYLSFNYKQQHRIVSVPPLAGSTLMRSNISSSSISRVYLPMAPPSLPE